MKTVYFEFINPPPNVALWEVAFTNNPAAQYISDWHFTGFQVIGTRIKATMADDDLWVAFYAGISGQQATYGVAYQQATIFVNNATYVWDVDTETLTLKGSGEPPPVVESDFMSKYGLAIGVGAVALVGMVLVTRQK